MKRIGPKTKLRCIKIEHSHPDNFHYLEIGEIYTVYNVVSGYNHTLMLEEINQINPDRPYFNAKDFEVVDDVQNKQDLYKAYDSAMKGI